MKTLTYNDYLSDITKERIYRELLKNSGLYEKLKETEKEIYDVVRIIINSAMNPDIKRYWENGCQRIQKMQGRIDIKYKDFVPDSTGLYPETSDSPLMVPGYCQRELSYSCFYPKCKWDSEITGQIFPALDPENPDEVLLSKLIDLTGVKNEYLETLKNILYKYGETCYKIDTFLHKYKFGFRYRTKFLKNITTWGALKKRDEEWFKIACELEDVDQTSFTSLAGKTEKDSPETKSNLVESTIDRIRRSITNNPNP